MDGPPSDAQRTPLLKPSPATSAQAIHTHHLGNASAFMAGGSEERQPQRSPTTTTGAASANDEVPSENRQAMGVSSSQSSGGGSAADSRSSSPSSTAVAAAPTLREAVPSAGDTNKTKTSGATPATTPPANHSPALGPSLNIRVAPERAGRNGRKHKANSGGVGSTRSGRTNSASGNRSAGGGLGAHDEPRYPRTSFDRCKTARAMAAQWMSRLMNNPPTEASIESARATRQARGPAKTATVADNDSSGHASPSGTLNKAQALSTTPCKQRPKGELSNGSTFLEAVLKTKTTSTTAEGSPATASATAAAPISSASDSEGPAAAGAVAVHYESLELVPSSLSAVASLLYALREIALSCASLNALAKASSPKGANSDDGGSQKANSGNASLRGPSSLPPTNAAAAAARTMGSSPSTTVASAPPVDEAVCVACSKELSDEYEAQWDAVRAHFAAVRQLILNDAELVEALDAALGTDWRTEKAEKREAVPSRRGSEAVEVEAGAGKAVLPATPLSLRAVAASSPLSRSAKEYVPRDFNRLTFSAAAEQPPSALDDTAAVAANSTLNSNAEPFHTRFTSSTSAADIAATSPSAASSTALSTHHAAASYSGHQPNVSIERGSVGTPVYSPSQAVASFLERGSPPPHADVGSCGAVFPSTPPTGETILGAGKSNNEDSNLNSVPPHRRYGGSTVANHSHEGSTTSSPDFSPAAAATTIGGAGGSAQPYYYSNSAASPHQPAPISKPSHAASSPASTPAFRLESREDMLRRRNAAPNAFYASATHYYPGAGNGNTGVNSAATTPASLYASSPNTLKQGVYLPTSGGLAHGPRSMPVSPLISYSTPVLGPQCPFDYILVIDFEATCEEHPPLGYLYEIIEFPVVLIDVHVQRAVDEFHRFVRPRYKTQLSEFCKTLTGITQTDVDEAAPLEEVILQFERWFHQTLPPNARTVFATDGPMDFKEFMHNHSVVRQRIRFPSIFYQWIDVKQTFANFFHCQQGKIKVMLEVLNCPFEGRLHSGIDDARNIARIVIALLQLGCTFCDVPLNRIQLPPAVSTLSLPSSGPQNHSSNSSSSMSTVKRQPDSASLPTTAFMGNSSSAAANMASRLAFGSPLHLPPPTVDAYCTHSHITESNRN